MKLDQLINHLHNKGLSKPTKADPTIPPVLNLPEEEVTTLIPSRIDLKKLYKPNYNNENNDIIQEHDWLKETDIEIPKEPHQQSDILDEDTLGGLGGKHLDTLGWYCPFHFYEDAYGIYIKSQTIRDNARALINVMTASEIFAYQNLSPRDKIIFSHEIKRAAFFSIFNHEMYHHFVESFATRLEMVDEKPVFVDYSRNIFGYFQNPLHDNLIEEALATGYPLRYFRQNAAKLFKKFPHNLSAVDLLCRFEFAKIMSCKVPGYRGAKKLLKIPKATTSILSRTKSMGISSNSFNNLQSKLQQTISECNYPPVGDSENWLFASHMMKPYFERGMIAYEVLEPHTLSTTLPTTTHYLQLSPRKALKIARKNWGIRTEGWGKGDHAKVVLPKSQKRIDFDTGYNDIPRKEWDILIEGMNEVLGANYRNNEIGRRKFVMGT